MAIGFACCAGTQVYADMFLGPGQKKGGQVEVEERPTMGLCQTWGTPRWVAFLRFSLGFHPKECTLQKRDDYSVAYGEATIRFHSSPSRGVHGSPSSLLVVPGTQMAASGFLWL